MNRRKFMKQLGQSISLLFCPAIMHSCSSHKRPNILFIMSDDHAVQAVSCLGSKINKTPNIWFTYKVK